MALRYIVPGVLALVGCWWWYTSRKKVQITSEDNEETQDMLSLPTEGSVTHGSKEIAPTVSSGVELAKAECPEPETEVAGDTLAVPFAENVQVDLVEDSPSSTKDECAQSVLRHSVGPESPMESASVPLSASTPLSDASVGPQHHVNGDFSQPAETSDINEELQHLAASLITEVISAALQEVMEVRSYEISEAASSCAPDKEPTTVEPVCQNESSHLSTGDEQDLAMQPQDKNTEEQETDTKEDASTVSSGVDLPKAECPELEAEVTDNILAVPFAENVQVVLVKDSPSSTRDDLSSTAPKAVVECAQTALGHSFGPESPMVSASFPLSASILVSEASVGPQHHVNGDFSRPAETSDINEELQHLAASLITEVISAALQEVMEVSSYEISEAASSCAPDKEPTTVEPVCQNESSHLSTGDEQDLAMQPQDKNTEEQETDTKEDAPTVSSGVDLPKAECPEPEAEVTDDILAVPFAENVQVVLEKDSPSSTRDDLSSTAPKAVVECAQSALGHSFGPESPMVSASFPLSASILVSEASVGPQHHVNGDFSQPAETRDINEELQHLAASLITEVISVALQEVMAVSSCAPSFNDKEPTKDEDLHTSHVGSSSQSHTDDIQEQAAQIVKEVINSCLTSFVWEKAEDKQECLVSSQGQLASTPVLPKLQAEEIITATEDSGCSTSQSEDGISDMDLLLGPGLFSAVPESIEDPIQNSGFSTEPVCPPVTVIAHGQQDTPSCTGATTDFQQDIPGTTGRSPPVPSSTLSNLVEKCSHNRPDAAAVSTESSHLSTGDEQDLAMQPQDENTDEQEPDTKEDAPTVSSGVDLPKAECPEPEGEVADDILAVPFAENVQVDLVKDSPSSTRDDLSTTAPKAVGECVQSAPGHPFGPESPMVSASFPLPASTPLSDASVGSQHHVNGDFSRPAETSDNTENLQHMAASLITEVNSVGLQEVMAVSSCAPSFNDEPTKDEDLRTSHVGSSSQSHTDDIQEQAAQIVKEVINSCLTPSIWEKAKDKQECLVSSQGQLALTPVLPKLQATEAIPATKDSGCSTSQSEDGISDKDLLLDTGLFSAVSENKEEPIQNSGFSTAKPVCPPVTVMAHGQLGTPSSSSATADSEESSPIMIKQNPQAPTSTLSNAVEKAAAVSTESSHLPTGDEQDSATQPQNQTTDKQETDTSTCQPENGTSSKDLLLSTAVPESKDDLNEMSGISRGSEKKEDGLQESSNFSPVLTRDHVAAVCEAALLNGPGLRNGTTKAEEGQSEDANSMGSTDSCFTLRTGGQQSGSQARPSQSSELIEWEIEVPKHLVSRLIGKQGKYLSFLKQRSGAEIYIITLPYTEEVEICHIKGTQQQVDKGLALIGKKFRNLDLTNISEPLPLLSLPTMNQQSGSQASLSQSSELIKVDFEVPKHLVSRLIGKQGKYMNFLKQSSGAEVYIITLPSTEESEICHVEGTQQQVDEVLALIGKKFRSFDLTNLHVLIPLPSLPTLDQNSSIAQRVTHSTAEERRLTDSSTNSALFPEELPYPPGTFW